MLREVPDSGAVWISDSQMKGVHDVTVDFGAPQAPAEGSSGWGLLREGHTGASLIVPCLGTLLSSVHAWRCRRWKLGRKHIFPQCCYDKILDRVY